MPDTLPAKPDYSPPCHGARLDLVGSLHVALGLTHYPAHPVLNVRAQTRKLIPPFTTGLASQAH